MANLNDYFYLKNIQLHDGHTQQSVYQTEMFKLLIKMKSPKRVMEIGFNGGHSAELFLSLSPDVRVVSFDIGEHEYYKLGKEYIDKKFPGRHRLVLGNSVKTVPEYARGYPHDVFDLIFIDGSHEFDDAMADIVNCRQLANSETMVIIDDTIYNPEWAMDYSEGPTRAWLMGVKQQIIQEEGRIDIAHQRRGMSWGRYRVA